MKWIDLWCKEYDIEDPETIDAVYDWINDETIGLCTFHYGDAHMPRWCWIQITDVFKGYPLVTKCVLWHEFCHAEIWIKEGRSDGHGWEWNKRLWRKPILYILDNTYTKLLFAILKSHRGQ